MSQPSEYKSNQTKNNPPQPYKTIATKATIKATKILEEETTCIYKLQAFKGCKEQVYKHT